MSTNNSSDQHLFIISLDALNAQDFDYIKTLPNFKSFLEEGSYVKSVTSVYPTVTYTCHSSIITGTYPDKHGIYSNEKFQPHRSTHQEWHWFRKDILVPTLFDYAATAGLKTANVFWPVMAGANIHYNCPEIWSVTGQSYLSLYSKYASKNTLWSILKNASISKGMEQPYLDNFVETIALDMIKKRKPHLLCMHLIELDHARHVFGLHEQHINSILERLDQRLGRIMAATKAAGIYDQTTFILLGDHGGTNFHHMVYMNTLFAEEGLLEVDAQNNITTWKAYVNACAGSAQVHIKDPSDAVTFKKVNDLLGKLSAKPGTFIKTLYTKQEALNKHHLSGDFDFVLEPKQDYIFSNGIQDKLIKNRAAIGDSYRAEHGQEPTHPDLHTLLLAKGNQIKKGVCLEHACIVDEGPTFAKILGLEMLNVDGHILHDLLDLK